MTALVLLALGVHDLAAGAGLLVHLALTAR